MRFATLKDGCTCDPGCYPEGCRTYCPVHGDRVARHECEECDGRGTLRPGDLGLDRKPIACPRCKGGRV